jgi:phage tail tape-measure protein
MTQHAIATTKALEAPASILGKAIHPSSEDDLPDNIEHKLDEILESANISAQNPFIIVNNGKKDFCASSETPTRLANGKRGAVSPMAATLAKKQAMKVPSALSQEAELPSEWFWALKALVTSSGGSRPRYCVQSVKSYSSSN